MSENKCYHAYDVNRHKAFGYTNMSELSPFVLIDPNDKLNQYDISQLVSKMKEACESVSKGYNPSSKYINRSILEDALNNPNEEVRELARELLDILKKNQELEFRLRWNDKK